MVKQMREEKVDPLRSRIIHTPEGGEDHSKSGGQVAAALTVMRRDNLGERVRQMIRSEQLARDAMLQGQETFDEADDFNVGDDYDPTSPYEEVFEGDIKEDIKQRSEAIKANEKTGAEADLAELLEGLSEEEKKKLEPRARKLLGLE